MSEFLHFRTYVSHLILAVDGETVRQLEEVYVSFIQYASWSAVIIIFIYTVTIIFNY